MNGSRPKLLPRADLVVTGPLDQADWNYQGPLGWASRRRFRMVTRLLGPGRYPELLEVGYGSGVFLPALADHAEVLFGCDVHDLGATVETVLARHGVTARLATGSVTALPYDDASFDAVVTVSTLEFVDDLDAAAAELARVLRPGGRLVVVNPGTSRVLDGLLRLATGERAEATFQGRRQRVQPALRRALTVERTLAFPPGAPPALRMYTALALRRR